MQINIQPIEKYLREDPGVILDVHSIFPTIQGEGPFNGVPATFIRLAGCNLQCPSCDTAYTHGRSPMAVEEIVEECSRHPTYKKSEGRLIVITGGEPFRQNLVPLVLALRARDFNIQIETNGTLRIPFLVADNALVVCSPKTGTVRSPRLVYAWKYVMHADRVDPKDGLPTMALGHDCSGGLFRPEEEDWEDTDIYLSPEDSGNVVQNQKNLAACVKSCQEFGYILSIQTHKIAGIE